MPNMMLHAVSCTISPIQNITIFSLICFLRHRNVSILQEKQESEDEKIILDPGVGFGKTFEMNLETMNHLELFKNLGFPVLLGTSRKSMIGLALDLPVDQRVEGTLATSVIGVMKGCSFVRVHDVKENRRVIQMTEAILGCN